ncbi:16S rRNA processing protein RimM [Niastella koreensis GR20-10]|uniref:Ribosome maturation factor RimM n=2 Tax=Niastella koreensis TaxID=354356 RepID=G8TQL0_NIAKG|nr:16S rRNA processing protein RimM [Niastella koreensis GR20-10]
MYKNPGPGIAGWPLKSYLCGLMTNYNSIGKIVATFGVKGEVVLQHQLGKKTSLKGLESVFIEEKKDEMLPYFLEGARIKNDDELFLKFEGINTKEAAHKLMQKRVWLPQEEFEKYVSKSAPIMLLGYHIINEGTDLGEILEIIEQPHQLLCRIDLKGKEALIPVHEDFLLKIDKKKKQVHVELPEGLLDIYS